MTLRKRRVVVSDLGFGFAGHDTEVEQQYAFKAGRDADHKSTNPLNTKRVEVTATREEAVRIALELNKKHEAGHL